MLEHRPNQMKRQESEKKKLHTNSNQSEHATKCRSNQKKEEERNRWLDNGYDIQAIDDTHTHTHTVHRDGGQKTKYHKIIAPNTKGNPSQNAIQVKMNVHEDHFWVVMQLARA